jgi:hypothetical protein
MDLDYGSQVIDDSETFEIVPDREESFEENKKRLDAFLYESPERDCKIRAMYRMYQLIGQKNSARIYRTLKNLKMLMFGTVDRSSY